MKLSRHTNRNLARLLLALALFAQGIMTAHACTSLVATPAMVAIPEQEFMPCHEGAAQKQPAPDADSCLTHCSQADQVSVDQHDAPVAAPTNVIVVSIQPQAQHIASPITPQYVALNTGPPIPIRFCSLLN
jgi:hypothetical protein